MAVPTAKEQRLVMHVPMVTQPGSVQTKVVIEMQRDATLAFVVPKVHLVLRVANVSKKTLKEIAHSCQFDNGSTTKLSNHPS